MPNSNETLIAALRKQARAIDPSPPPDMRRRVFSAVAELRQPARRLSMGPRLLALLGTAAVTALVAVLLHHHNTAPDSTATPKQVVRAHRLPSFPDPAPLALAHHLLDDPMQGEVQSLYNDLSRTTGTISAILPSPAKRAKTTPPPAGQSSSPAPGHVA